MQPYIGELYVPPLIQPTPCADGAQLRIWMVPSQAQLHSELPNQTAVWTYRASPDMPLDPQSPVGPTIEVQQGQRTHVAWVNALTNPDGSFARHPVVAVRDLPAVVQLADSGTVHAPQNPPDFTLGRCNWPAGQVPPWAVVHLHGGRTAADADGLPESECYPGRCSIRSMTTSSRPRRLVAIRWRGRGRDRPARRVPDLPPGDVL
jgi:FtsP/CotA-like multicopper oxidase with cupredoxin domain